MQSDYDLKKVVSMVLVALIVGKIFGPVGLAVMALLYLWKVGTKSKEP